MPLYEYQCESCGHRFEIRQSFKDEPLTVCPRCGGPIHLLIQAPAIVFKGSGFYVTDHRAGNGNAAKKDKAESTTTEGGETKTAETSAASASDSTSSAAAAEPAKTESKTETAKPASPASQPS